MQLVKTMGVVERLKAACVPYISVMTDPTTGGVFASFAVVGDVNLAEPNAIIRFAGDRVSAGTIGEELPPGYQRAEFWFSHGFVDRIVARAQLRDEIITLLEFLAAPAVQGATEAPAAPASWPRSILSALTGTWSGDNDGETRGSYAAQPRGEATHG
jgi:acetyl-CoA carboxylase carboxyl transferase subunit beta